MPTDTTSPDYQERRRKIEEEVGLGFRPDPEASSNEERQVVALEFIAVALGELVKKIDGLDSRMEKIGFEIRQMAERR